MAFSSRVAVRGILHARPPLKRLQRQLSVLRVRCLFFISYYINAEQSIIVNGVTCLRLNVLSKWACEKFLSVELERLPSEQDDLDRRAREANLQVLMERTLHSPPSQQRTRVAFGIVAIGRYSCFHKLEEGCQRESIMVEDIRVFHMSKQARSIAYILQNHVKE
ncbi:uncharacterized protein BO97DRAFT_421157 [Aspergillus homomorphus CBS 101889]|uniref:Uncharacterized protein n=1 Tax=Aspergillus homomorphus (strain CBS 101889) TaxID=1450537 RepID=A0A395I7W8_ASPHC|nr:hypothetical protein BO97DRAFT_421157 [Aspergillus homomorphus CBS 101889]RAL15909.1 hypothetical protein BO97DRAFT_421157 [Aspergillus homomorphus CBS 101889]